ncbi:MAG TPA: hypothetical protein VGB51_11165 [Actinomycetota bacterium]
MTSVEERFTKIGARARVLEARRLTGLRVDVRTDRRGELFDLWVPDDVRLDVLDLQPRDRHLLLMARGEEKSRFLCGHDERHWFAAAVPERIPVTTVAQARDALKPALVRARQGRLAPRLRDRRRNPVFVRQGEWFFLPAPGFAPRDWVILRREPLSRGRGTPHVAEEAVRSGGETVYTSFRHPRPLGPTEYDAFLRRHPEARRWSWEVARRDPEVHVRGRVTHPDHRTVVLRGWHLVLPNTEQEARAAGSLAFID